MTESKLVQLSFENRSYNYVNDVETLKQSSRVHTRCVHANLH